MDLSRRDFLASGTVVAGASLSGASAAAPVMLAQAGPAPRGFDPADATLRYDLVIANADVLDPSQRLRGKRDIGIKNGQIAALSSTPIAADRSAQRYDAAGRLATPGLVDLHTHYGPLIGAIGLPADELVPITATTTGVSAGDAGAKDRKSTRLNSSHQIISYAVFCLKKKKKTEITSSYSVAKLSTRQN